MLFIYKLLAILLSPLLRAFFYARCLYGKDKIEHVCNHFGVPTLKRPAGRLLWIHAVSVGESMAALTYIIHIKKQFPDLNVLLTTTTLTSASNLAPKIEKISGCFHQFMVFDNPFWVTKFLNYWNVDAAIFMESEIWPNIIDSLYRRKIPIFLLNARLSPSAFKNWKIFGRFFSGVLQKFECILAQSDVDALRYRFFSPNNVRRIDNLKLANAVLPYKDSLLKIMKKICSGKKVLVAASTHEKEEEVIAECHRMLKKDFNIMTIIIPRHLARLKSICGTLDKCGIKFFLRSQIKDEEIDEWNQKLEEDVICVDAFGEVGTFFRLADVCFVGGSLVPVGGHNIYEPVALGKPVLHGPYMDNTSEARDFLKKRGVAFEVKNQQEIYETCKRLFSDKKGMVNISAEALSATKNESLNQIDEVIQLEKFV